MSGASFGRKGAAPDPDLAARRAAFLAAERARAQQAPREADASGGRFDGPQLVEPAYVRRKTNGTAYLLWLAFGGFSAHRFYLGLSSSAFVQALLAPIGYAMVLSKSPAGLFAITASGLWLLIDAFMLPSMVAKANARARQLALTTTLA